MASPAIPSAFEPQLDHGNLRQPKILSSVVFFIIASLRSLKNLGRLGPIGVIGKEKGERRKIREFKEFREFRDNP